MHQHRWIRRASCFSEISQTVEDKYCTVSLPVEFKKYNKLVNIVKKRQTHRYGEQTSGDQWGEGRGVGQERRVRGTNYHE